MNHPRLALDPMIHTPVRLSVMAILARSERVDFRFLGDTLEVSDSLLSKHLSTLEEAGFVNITKTNIGKRSRTWIGMTPAGSKAFATYQRALLDIVGKRFDVESD